MFFCGEFADDALRLFLAGRERYHGYQRGKRGVGDFTGILRGFNVHLVQVVLCLTYVNAGMGQIREIMWDKFTEAGSCGRV